MQPVKNELHTSYDCAEAKAKNDGIHHEQRYWTLPGARHHNITHIGDATYLKGRDRGHEI